MSSPRKRRALKGTRPSVEALEDRVLLSLGITEFPIPGPNVYASAITQGKDGNLWFTASGAAGGVIGRVTPAGTIDEFSVPSPDFVPYAIAAGSDRNVWFTESQGELSRIGRITPLGTITELAIPSPRGGAAGIAAGPDNAMWFTEPDAGQIGRIDEDGRVREFPVPASTWGASNPTAITQGPDGALWFTGAGIIGRITTDGQVHDYVLPSGGTPAAAITTGPDGNLWFSFNSGGYGKVATDGTLKTFMPPGPTFSSGSITDGPDGALWFTNFFGHEIGRITADGSALGLFPVPSVGNPTGITTGPGGTLWYVEAPNSAPGATTSHVGEIVFNVTDAPLTVTPVALTPTTGQQFAGAVASFTDADPNGSLADYKAAVNFGSQTADAQPGAIVPDGKGGYLVYASSILNTSGQAQVTVFDTRIVGSVGGATGSVTDTVTVKSPPFAATSNLTATASAAGVGSAAAIFNVRFGGPAFDNYTANIDWGDGTPLSPGTLTNAGFRVVAGVPSNVYAVDGQHAYAQSGIYLVHVTLIQTTSGLRAAAGAIVTFDKVLPPLTASGMSLRGGLAIQNAIVATFRDPGGALPLGAYRATIDWGDGTPTTLGSIAQPLGVLTVYGTHTYAASGHYIIQVTIVAQDGRTVSTSGTADVAATPVVPLKGSLSAASDSGASSSDGITNVRTPTFAGTAAPGATVRVYAEPFGHRGLKLVGQGTADARGFWSVTTGALADGAYAFAASATEPDGTAERSITLYAAASRGPIIIDTLGPRLTALRVNPAAGQVILMFRDRGPGLDNLTLRNAAAYTLRVNGIAGPIVAITSVAVSPSGASVVVVLTINGGRALRRGRYAVRIAAGDLFDLAGNPLDGAFLGKLPSGNGRPGSDFAALFRVTRKGGAPHLSPVPGHGLRVRARRA